MKKTIIIFLMLFLILMSACSHDMNIEDINNNFESLQNRSEAEILQFNKQFTIDELKQVKNYQNIDYCAYLYYLTGYNIGYISSISSSDPIESGAYTLNSDGVNKKRTLKDFNSTSPVVCIRKISQELLYTIHYVQGDYIYGFFKYDNQQKCWISTNQMFESCKKLNRSNFDSITIGSTLKEVAEIDPSQERAFYFKRICENEFVSRHILEDGLLTITYNGEVDNTTKAEDITVKSMEWSESLPILEQDLPA